MRRSVGMKRREVFVVVSLLMMSLSLIAWGRYTRPDRYKVIGRTNGNSSLVVEVPVVLEHDGHKYYARCNNIKGVENPSVTRHCELHVGMTVECELFTSRDVNGYDLICGSKRNKDGKLDTYGENELLFVDREEN